MCSIHEEQYYAYDGNEGDYLNDYENFFPAWKASSDYYELSTKTDITMMMLIMLLNIQITNHDHVFMTVFVRIITTQPAGIWHLIVDRHFVMDTNKFCF